MPDSRKISPKLTGQIGAGKFLQVAPAAGPERVGFGVRLMFENSTVCHMSTN